MTQPTFQYETIGNKSFLIATLADAKDLINYQMQMLANNEIPNILPVSKRQKNEDIQLCYNVTSKVSLTQAVSRNKISKQGFLKLIEGAISAFNELGEYQLVTSGLVLDSDHVFVKTGTFEPCFVYLPVSSEDSGIIPLKDFLLELVLQSKVEITNDNFIQVTLEVLNSLTLNIEELTKLVKVYGEKSTPVAPVVERTPVRPMPQPRREPERVHTPPPVAPASPIEPEPKVSIPNKVPINPQPSPTVKGKKDSKEDKSSKTKEQHPKKNLFLIVQIVLMAAIVALAMSGVLNDAETGSLNFTYLLGCLIPAVGIDFVLYREWFKNSGKEKAPKEAETKKIQPKTSSSGVAIPGRTPVSEPVSVPAPKPAPPVQPKAAPIETPKPTPAPVSITPPPVVRQPVTASPINSNPFADFETEDTVVDTGVGSMGGACLEYYENGLLTKIKLDKSSVIVGRMRSQVDYAINDSKIGKVHAEFISDNGNYFVQDYNSTNGTYVNGNGQRIPGNTPQQIFDGDRITLANIDLTLRC